jgi:hypothetical protein
MLNVCVELGFAKVCFYVFIRSREATKMEHLFTLRPNPYLVRNTYELSKPQYNRSCHYDFLSGNLPVPKIIIIGFFGL